MKASAGDDPVAVIAEGIARLKRSTGYLPPYIVIAQDSLWRFELFSAWEQAYERYLTRFWTVRAKWWAQRQWRRVYWRWILWRTGGRGQS